MNRNETIFRTLMADDVHPLWLRYVSFRSGMELLGCGYATEEDMLLDREDFASWVADPSTEIPCDLLPVELGNGTWVAPLRLLDDWLGRFPG